MSINLFGENAENVVNLRMDFSRLTHLSLDTVILPRKGRPDKADFPL